MTRGCSMYMHTLDGKPANCERVGKRTHLYYLLQRSVAKLRPALSDIRGDWNECLETYERLNAPCAREALHAEFKRYGYVLVEVPT